MGPAGQTTSKPGPVAGAAGTVAGAAGVAGCVLGSGTAAAAVEEEPDTSAVSEVLMGAVIGAGSTAAEIARSAGHCTAARRPPVAADSTAGAGCSAQPADADSG